MTPVIEVRSLCKSFEDVRVLHDLSFTVEEGRVLGYLGRNGSGKTTTIRMLTGLLKADSGGARIRGADVAKEYESLLGRVAVMFDENGLYESLDGLTNLSFYLKACGSDASERDIKSALDTMGLRVDRRKVKSYSKGMKRKLVLARTLLVRPAVMLLDEPFDGVDIESRAALVPVIKGYVEQTGCAAVITSHVMADIEDLASDIAILKGGKLAVHDTIESFTASSSRSLTEQYLERIR